MSLENTTKMSTEISRDTHDDLLLTNSNVREDDRPIPPSNSTYLIPADSRTDRIKNAPKNRSKSPSFFKMLVGRGTRKLSNQEIDYEAKQEVTADSFSDNDEPIAFSPTIPDSDRQRIDHIATLPRKSSISKKGVAEKESVHQLNEEISWSPSHESFTTNFTEQGKEKQAEGEDMIDDAVEKPTSIQQPTEHFFVGLEALEMLHNQLQILVIQDCDSEMADIMPDNVTESMHKQILDLQKSLAFQQKSNQDLRLSLKMAEMRAQEAELKLNYSSHRGLQMEDKYFRLEKEYNILYQNYCTLEKHLQKQAVLHQMQLSPMKKLGDRRPNSANNTMNRKQKSFESTKANSAVRRHNSSEFLTHHHSKKTVQKLLPDQADVNPCSTLPTRLHSGSLSHTETRV